MAEDEKTEQPPTAPPAEKKAADVQQPSSSQKPAQATPALNNKQKNLVEVMKQVSRHLKTIQFNLKYKEKLCLVKVDKEVHNAYFWMWGRDCAVFFKLAVMLKRRYNQYHRELGREQRP